MAFSLSATLEWLEAVAASQAPGPVFKVCQQVLSALTPILHKMAAGAEAAAADSTLDASAAAREMTQAANTLRRCVQSVANMMYTYHQSLGVQSFGEHIGGEAGLADCLRLADSLMRLGAQRLAQREPAGLGPSSSSSDRSPAESPQGSDYLAFLEAARGLLHAAGAWAHHCTAGIAERQLPQALSMLATSIKLCRAWSSYKGAKIQGALGLRILLDAIMPVAELLREHPVAAAGRAHNLTQFLRTVGLLPFGAIPALTELVQSLEGAPSSYVGVFHGLATDLLPPIHVLGIFDEAVKRGPGAPAGADFPWPDGEQLVMLEASWACGD